MATATSSKQMPKPVRRKLNRMRGKLTRWIMVHGVGRWLLAIVAILGADMLLDRVFRMDAAQRLVMLVVMAVAVIAYFAWRVVKPMLARPNDDALIYEVESKNPGLKENLITGVQLSREKDLRAQGVSAALADATISNGLKQAEAIDFGKALNLSEYMKNWVLLLIGVVLLAGIGFGVTQTNFLRTWFNRNIMLLDDQWPQSTYLEIVGAKDGKLILPRGNDHRQIVVVREDSKITDVNVSLEVDNPGGRTIHGMKPTGKLDGRERVFMFHNVSSKFRFRASGGDDVTDWVDVELVEPPNIIELDMNVLMPECTGIEKLPLTGNGPHSVLVGSKLQMAITTNKPLSKANLKLGDEVFEMTQGADDKQFELLIPGDEGELRGGEYEFELVDTGGLSSSRRSKFKLAIKEDDIPKVRASLLGISGLVSARAMLPTSFQAADEYGLTKLAFDCNWKLGVDDEQAVVRNILFDELGMVDGKPVRNHKDDRVLDLLALKLTPGTSFKFAVAASDNHPEKPNVGRSQEFLLRVVSDEELRADLLRREIEQRKAFDQAYQVQLELSTELQAVAARLPEPGASQEEFDATREASFINLVQNQKGIGTAIDRIANRFEEFLVEVKNNRLDEAENEIAPDQRIERRFDEKIIKPIRRLDQELVSMATRNLDNCRRAATPPAEFEQAVGQTVAIHNEILEEMKKILSAMNDSESFQEIINDILEVKKEQMLLLNQGIQKKKDPFDKKKIFDNK